MKVWQILLAIVLAALSVVAIGVCLYALVFDGRLDFALIGAVILLALAQLISLFTRAGSKQDAIVNIKDLMQANASLSEEHSLVRRRLERMETNFISGENAAAERLDAQVSALEHSVSALTRQGRQDLQPSDNRAEPFLETRPTPRELDLFLEPIVGLAENRTAYYRASLAVRNNNGERLPVSKIARDAERAGFLSELDLAIFERAAPVIRRFQNNRRNIAVFCPVSASSFADDGFVHSLVALLRNNLDIATALVIEITQTALSQLSDQGQEGLACLAQLGATFSLSNVRLDVPDMTTLRELGFAFICVDVQLLVALKNEGHYEPGSLLVQAARCNLSVIAADVVKQSEYAWIESTVPFAYGTYFSPPRLVRHDITVEEEPAKVA